MPRRGVGVLTHDEHVHLGEGSCEGSQDVLARRQIAATGRDLGPKEAAQGGDVGSDRFQGGCPAGVDQLLESAARHAPTLVRGLVHPGQVVPWFQCQDPDVLPARSMGVHDMKASSRATLVGAVALAVAVVVPAAATAAPEPPETIAQGLVGPLQIDVGSDGQVYVAQDFIGVLTKIRPNGTTKTLTAFPGEIAGVASNGYDVAFTGSDGGETSPPTITFLKVRKSNGSIHTIANLLKYEQKHNPDAGNVYGFRNLSKKCAAKVARRDRRRALQRRHRLAPVCRGQRA